MSKSEGFHPERPDIQESTSIQAERLGYMMRDVAVPNPYVRRVDSLPPTIRDHIPEPASTCLWVVDSMRVERSPNDDVVARTTFLSQEKLSPNGNTSLDTIVQYDILPEVDGYKVKRDVRMREESSPPYTYIRDKDGRVRIQKTGAPTPTTGLPEYIRDAIRTGKTTKEIAELVQQHNKAAKELEAITGSTKVTYQEAEELTEYLGNIPTIRKLLG